jgi:hypothetical protein
MFKYRAKHERKLVSIVLMLSLTCLQSSVCFAAKPKGNPTVDPNKLSGGLIKTNGYYLPRGLKIPVELRTPVDTRMSQQGDQVTVQVMQDVIINDYVIIPTNSFMHGFISKLDKPGKFYKNPTLEINFDRIAIPQTNLNRELSIKGLIRQKELMTHSEKVNFGDSYKKRAAMAAGVGGTVTGSGAYAFLALANPYDTFGIAKILDFITFGSAVAGGAALGAALVTRDDVRMEPGTKLDVLLEESTYDNFTPEHALSQHKLEDKPMSLSEEYDRLSTMQAEKL